MSLRRNALLLVLLTGLLAILGQWSPPFARWDCLPAAALLLGLACEAAVLAGQPLAMRLVTPDRCLLGRPHPLQFVFRHGGRGTLCVQAALAAPEQIACEPRIATLRLAPDIETSTSIEAVGRRLGSFVWPTPDIRAGGVLGLAWWPRRIAATPCAVTVVPDLVGCSGPQSGTRRAGEHGARAMGSGTEILQLREYRRGDPLRLIDWKASARRGRPISREMSEDQHLEILIAVDAGRASGLAAGEVDRLSLYVNIAARLAQRAAERGDAIGLLVFAGQPLAALAPARGALALSRLRRMLAECRVQPAESNPVLAAARIRGMARRRTLLVLLTDLEDASATGQLVQAMRLLRPKHFALVAGLESAGIAGLASAAAREPLGAYRALAALEYGKMLSANVRALRSLGAAAIVARPEHLDRAVFNAYREHRLRRRI